MLCGSGELGKEIAIAGQRLGCKDIACDRYEGAPAMQIADEGKVLDMTDGNQLKDVIQEKNPDIIKTSPLIFLYKDISDQNLKIIKENCYFSYLDFDAY